MAEELTGSQIAFYATSATVIPVLMLAFAVQLDPRRSLSWFVGEGRVGEKLMPWLALAVLALMSAGEWLSVTGLMQNDKSGESKEIVLAAVVVAVLVFYIGVLRLVLDRVKAASPAPRITSPQGGRADRLIYLVLAVWWLRRVRE